MAEHHPSDVLLLDHASGGLPTAAGLPILAHLDNCAACHAAAELWGLVGRALIPQSPQGPPAENAARLLRQLDCAAVKASSARLGPAWAERVGDFKIGRRRWIAPGIWTAHIHAPIQAGWRVFVLGVTAGGVVPAHGHDGAEYVHVYQGAFASKGRTYRAGDFLALDVEDVHALQVSQDGPCICLIASEAPLKWKGWLRFFQLWIGI
jgi:putative transcriptional regulator